VISDTMKTDELLEQILIWIRASSFANVEAMLKKALPTEKERYAYQAMEPNSEDRKSAREIAKDLQISTATLSAIVKRCLAMGLMRRQGTIPIRLFDLLDFGLLPDEQKSAAKKDGDSE
jgi:hypothetical protein